jgi:serine/threonine-protein kinase HipA
MRKECTIFVGENPIEVGKLSYEKKGQKSTSAFLYSDSWLRNPDQFALSPDLPLISGYQFHSARTSDESPFFACFSDVEPDGWGKMVIQRDFAKQRKGVAGNHRTPTLLDDFDYLMWISDFSRIGAIRLKDSEGIFQRRADHKRQIPPLIELPQLLRASKAIEENQETLKDLEYLRGVGTSLGGLRPKCSIIDTDGSLSIGKFPSVGDTRSIVHGEVLALHLAKRCGIDVASSKVIDAEGTPVALIKRFDREGPKRLMYLSANSLLQAKSNQQYTYEDIASLIRTISPRAKYDLGQLWKRMIFNVLINNVDDHLKNHGFLHTTGDQWVLAPAFDLNPFPDKMRALKTWISQKSGEVASSDEALAISKSFEISKGEAKAILSEMKAVISKWKSLAQTLGMNARDIEQYAPALEYQEP